MEMKSEIERLYGAGVFEHTVSSDLATMITKARLVRQHYDQLKENNYIRKEN